VVVVVAPTGEVYSGEGIPSLEIIEDIDNLSGLRVGSHHRVVIPRPWGI
jgi:hypothetical protein